MPKQNITKTLDKLTERKLIVGDFKAKKLEDGIEELKKKPIFTNTEFFINKEKNQFFINLEGKLL